jgi:hypothetical protein
LTGFGPPSKVGLNIEIRRDIAQGVEEAFDASFKRAFYVEIDIPDAIGIAIFKCREAFQRSAEVDGVSS